MMYTLPQNADRYTLLVRPIGKIAEVLAACAELGLHWFITTSPGNAYNAEIRIFFDKEGVENYMHGLYDEP